MQEAFAALDRGAAELVYLFWWWKAGEVKRGIGVGIGAECM